MSNNVNFTISIHPDLLRMAENIAVERGISVEQLIQEKLFDEALSEGYIPSKILLNSLTIKNPDEEKEHDELIKEILAAGFRKVVKD